MFIVTFKTYNCHMKYYNFIRVENQGLELSTNVTKAM